MGRQLGLNVCSAVVCQISTADGIRTMPFCTPGPQCRRLNNPTCCGDRKAYSFPCSHATGAAKPCSPNTTSTEVPDGSLLTPRLRGRAGTKGIGHIAWIRSRSGFGLIPLIAFAWLVQRQLRSETVQGSLLFLPIAPAVTGAVTAGMQGTTGITQLLHQASISGNGIQGRNSPIWPRSSGRVCTSASQGMSCMILCKMSACGVYCKGLKIAGIGCFTEWENNSTLSREYPGCSVLDRITFKGSLKTLLLSPHLSMPPGLVLAQGPSVPPACCTCSRLLSPAQHSRQWVQALQHLLPTRRQEAILLCFSGPCSHL